MYPYLKRFIDITASFCGLLLLSPLLIFAAVLVRIKLGSPVFFRQERPGLHGKPFYMIKFRSMTNTKDTNGNLLPDEQRITEFGNFLRKTSIDELPELINVIKGDMSLIGPRPLLMKYLPYYTEEEFQRHNVRPGITGLAQINGRNTLPWNERLKTDVDYVHRLSFSLDTYILFVTFWKVFRRENVVLNPIESLDTERS